MNGEDGLRIYEGGVALITGGASGIGRALAEALARRGCRVVLADVQAGPVREAAAAIASAGGAAEAAEIDVRDYAAVDRLVREVRDSCGRLDYLFNNAGIGIGGAVHHYDICDWDYMIDVNLRGVVNGVQAAYGIMKAQGFGHIVNTASMAGLMPGPGMASYSMTKHAVVGLSKALRIEGADLGIRVSVLCPGVIRTPILEGGGKQGRMLVDIPAEVQRSMWERMKPYPADRFAEDALKAIARNQAVIIVPSWWKMIWRLHRFFPGFGLFLAGKQYRDFGKQAGL